MKLYSTLNFILVFFFLVGVTELDGQNRADLEKKKALLKEQITFTNQQIKKTQDSKKNNLKKLSLLKKQISSRNEMVSTIKKEISIIDDKHRTTKSRADSLETELQEIIEEYGKLLNKTYLLNQSKNSWIYILSSADMNVALQKWIYLRQFNSFRKSQYNQIENLKNSFQSELLKLDSLKQEKTSLLAEETKEISNIEGDIKMKNSVLSSLKADESKLRAKLKQQEKDQASLTASIEKIIKEEMEKAKAAKDNLALTPKAAKLASDFKQNKGKFSWPVSKGYISSGFGKQAHPTIKNLSIQNNGIDIRTEKNATVKAIFSGKVVGVVNVPGNNQMVIVRHGNYYTVYANLVKVSVKREEEIKMGQAIGKVYYNEAEEDSKLHFELWEEKDKQNPSHWLLSK